MNVLDTFALPMFDCFTDTKYSYDYTVIPNNSWLNEMNKPLSQLKGKKRNIMRNFLQIKAFKEVDSVAVTDPDE